MSVQSGIAYETNTYLKVHERYTCVFLTRNPNSVGRDQFYSPKEHTRVFERYREISRYISRTCKNLTTVRRLLSLNAPSAREFHIWCVKDTSAACIPNSVISKSQKCRSRAEIGGRAVDAPNTLWQNSS